MQLYLVHPRGRIFVKGYVFLFFFFAWNIDKNVKNISQNLRSKYSQEPLDHAKQSARDVLKTASKRTIQETAEVTGDLIGNKIANKITRVSKTLPKNNSETIEEDELRERFMPSELRHKIIDDLRLKKKHMLFN